MPFKKTVRLDHLIITAVACLVFGYLLGIGTAVMLQRPAAGPVASSMAPPPTVAPPSSPLGNLAAEIRELESIVGRDPTNRHAWVRLGNLYFDTDQHMPSIDAYTKALELDPNDPDVITDRGIMYRSIGDFTQAAAEFRRAAEAFPKHMNSALNLGVVLRYDLNDLPGAAHAWEMYLQRNPPAEMAENIRRELQAIK